VFSNCRIARQRLLGIDCRAPVGTKPSRLQKRVARSLIVGDHSAILVVASRRASVQTASTSSVVLTTTGRFCRVWRVGVRRKSDVHSALLRYVRGVHVIHSTASGPAPSPDELRALQRRMGPLDNEVPGAIAFHAVLGSTEGLAVALVGARAFSTGMSIEIAIRLRHSDTSPDGLDADLFGHRRRGAGGAGMLLGIAYPDGRSASNVDQRRFPELSTPADQLMLVGHGGGGGGRTYDMTYWLTPAPTPGDLTIIFAWPSRGIAESHTVIPAEVIEEAMARIVELWPWSPPEQTEHPAVEDAPDLPAGGWFAQHVTDDPHE
jgi:hypothetical protein